MKLQTDMNNEHPQRAWLTANLPTQKYTFFKRGCKRKITFVVVLAQIHIEIKNLRGIENVAEQEHAQQI